MKTLNLYIACTKYSEMRPTYSQLKGKKFKTARHNNKMERNKRKIEETREIFEAATWNIAKCVAIWEEKTTKPRKLRENVAKWKEHTNKKQGKQMKNRRTHWKLRRKRSKMKGKYKKKQGSKMKGKYKKTRKQMKITNPKKNPTLTPRPKPLKKRNLTLAWQKTAKTIAILIYVAPPCK